MSTAGLATAFSKEFRFEEALATVQEAEPLLHTLHALLRTPPPPGRCRLVIGTTAAGGCGPNAPDAMERALGLASAFDVSLALPAASAEELVAVSRGAGEWRADSGSSGAEDAAAAVEALVRARAPAHVAPPPLKDVLLALSMARTLSPGAGALAVDDFEHCLNDLGIVEVDAADDLKQFIL